MEKISSVKNQLIVTACQLKEKKYQFEQQKYLVEGSNIVSEALKHGVVETIFATKKHLLAYQDFKNVVEITENVAEKLTDLKQSQEVFAICNFTTNAFYRTNTLILDTIQDPGNLGTLIRTAYALNFKNIICSEETVSLYNPKVLRAVQGNHFAMHIEYQNLVTRICQLKEQGYLVLGTYLKPNKLPTTLKPPQNQMALVLGNEGQGISQPVIEVCDSNLVLELNQAVDSLNVAIAGAILMYKLNNAKDF